MWHWLHLQHTTECSTTSRWCMLAGTCMTWQVMNYIVEIPHVTSVLSPLLNQMYCTILNWITCDFPTIKVMCFVLVFATKEKNIESVSNFVIILMAYIYQMMCILHLLTKYIWLVAFPYNVECCVNAHEWALN